MSSSLENTSSRASPSLKSNESYNMVKSNEKKKKKKVDRSEATREAQVPGGKAPQPVPGETPALAPRLVARSGNRINSVL
jgi:hypothetical protein